MLIIGWDQHRRYQHVARVDTETGRIAERRLEHANGESPKVLRRIGRGRPGWGTKPPVTCRGSSGCGPS